MLVTAAIWTQSAGTAVTVAPLSAIDATSTSPAAVPAGFGIASDATAVELVVVAALWKTMPPPAAGVDVELDVGVGVAVSVAVGVSVGIVEQVCPKSWVIRETSVMSTKPSGGSGATS